MLLEEGDDLLPQFSPITYLEPIAEAVLGPVVALDVDFTASKKLAEFIEHRFIIRSEFKTEAGFHLGPTTLRLIEVNSKAPFAVHQAQNIVSG